MRGDALRGHLDLLILATLSSGPMHGYALIEQMRTRSHGEFEVAEGTVYPVLHRLAEAGFLASKWDDGSGRRRRVYRLTDEGVAALRREKVAWGKFSTAVAATLNESPWPSPS